MELDELVDWGVPIDLGRPDTSGKPIDLDELVDGDKPNACDNEISSLDE